MYSTVVHGFTRYDGYYEIIIMIKTILRELCRVGQLRIQIMLFLTSTDSYNTQFKPKKSFKRFIGQSGVSLTYDFPTFIVLDYTMSTGVFVKDNKMFIPLHQVPKLCRLFRKTIKVIDDPNGKIYYWDADHGNKLCMYNIPAEQLKGLINIEYGFSGNHIIKTTPTIVRDYQDNLYEGAAIYFDRHENRVDLSTDELYAVYYILERTDFITLGQALVNSLSVWANPAITKHIDIETVRSSDLRQRDDLNRANIEQPSSQGVTNVFGGLKTIQG